MLFSSNGVRGELSNQLSAFVKRLTPELHTKSTALN